jgi:hypothetical protein
MSMQRYSGGPPADIDQARLDQIVSTPDYFSSIPPE